MYRKPLVRKPGSRPRLEFYLPSRRRRKPIDIPGLDRMLRRQSKFGLSPELDAWVARVASRIPRKGQHDNRGAVITLLLAVSEHYLGIDRNGDGIDPALALGELWKNF